MTITAGGWVFGNFWGGGRGIYSASILKTKTLDELYAKLQGSEDIGEFDGGMGYEKVTGVVYFPMETKFDGDWKCSRAHEPILINRGMSKEEEIDFMEFAIGE